MTIFQSDSFSIEEEPSAAALYSKLSTGLDDLEEMSFYAEIKQKYARAKAFLQANHPQELERIGRLPNMVKTAYNGNPHGTFMFRRQGPSFFALVHEKESSEISEWPLEDAMKAIECQYGTKRISFSDNFWPHKDSEGKNIDGIYDNLKKFKPESLKQRGGSSDAIEAIGKLQKAMPQMSQTMRTFAGDIIEDIQSWGAIPQYTISKIARNPAKSKDDFDDLIQFLADFQGILGKNNLKMVKSQAMHDDIVVTIEKQ